MKLRQRIMVAAGFFLLELAPGFIHAEVPASPRLELAADAGWKFMLGDPSGAEAFRSLTVHGEPLTCRMTGASKTGLSKTVRQAQAEASFQRAWDGTARPSTRLPAGRGRAWILNLEGVYRDATVYLNGHKLVTHPYGYTSFSLDLTHDLKFGVPNVLAVLVDNSEQPNSRWYSG